MEVIEPDRVFSLIKNNISKYSNMTEETCVEPILQSDPSRFCLYPIRYHEIWQAYKNHKNSFWTAEEIDFSADLQDWEKLTDNERYFIEHILAFFAGSDGIVLENLVKNFCSEVQIPEARCFYAFQAMIENIHSEVYSLMIDTYIRDANRKEQLFNAITEIPCISKKAKWAIRWIEDPLASFATRLFAFSIVEGLFFSGSFCAIFWLKERGLMVASLGKSNEWIARDESLHTEFAILLYKYVVQKLDEQVAKTMMMEAVEIEEEFICKSLSVKLIGMDCDMMTKYVQFCADRLMLQFGFQKIYHQKNPFPFMEKISIDGKTNFFEQRVTEYSLGNLKHSETDVFVLDNLDTDIF